MIADALKYLTSLAQGAMQPVKVETGDPTKLTYLLGPNRVDIDKAIPPRDHGVDSLTSLGELAERFAGQSPVIWVDSERAVLVLDDHEGHRVETAKMNFVKSDVFRRLESLAVAKEWLDQKAFIRLLRIDLAGTLAPGVLLDRVRKIRFESGQVTTQETARNRESLGRQITAAVSAEGEIPEEVALEVFVFKGVGESFAITCSVDVDPARGFVQLSPLPDEIHRVMQLAVDDIRARIQSGLEAIPVYLGRP
jgi:hypothetical protein